MKRGRSVCLALALGSCCYTARASGVQIYTFGADFISPGATGAPDSLNSMDPASAASVAALLTPVGGGNVGFTGGLVAYNNLLYAIGNDSNGVATLYSMQTDGQGLAAVSSAFNNTGGAAGIVFQNGLAEAGGTFYAIGAGAGSEALYQIQSGTATQVAPLNTFNGTYTGLAWDSSLDQFYGIIAGASGAENGDLLVRFGLDGAVTVLADMNSLDSSQAGTHLGGIADAGGGILYSIYTNPLTFTGELEQINLLGGPSASTLYDTGIPLAQNAGMGLTLPAAGAPEPSAAFGLAGALLLLLLRRRRSPGNTA